MLANSHREGFHDLTAPHASVPSAFVHARNFSLLSFVVVVMPDYSLWCYSDILLLFQVVEQPKFSYKVKGTSLLSITSLADSSQYMRCTVCCVQN